MKREERKTFNQLKKTVEKGTIYVEIPETYGHEARQAIHDLLTIEKHMEASCVGWNDILNCYCVRYAPQSGKINRQEGINADDLLKLNRTDYTWNGYKKPEKQEDPDTETTTEKKEDETMTTNTTTTTAAEQTFPRLLAEITANYDRLATDTSHYIRLGWFPSWANEYHNNPDRGIKQYSTVRRWEQYKAGEITREKAIELAERRAANEIKKNRAGKIASLEAAANAPRISSASISVEWAKSRTWGANPTAELLNIGYGRTVGHASGCGYDKESAAIAEAMNASPATLRILYELGEAAIERGESPRSASACTGYNWGKCIGYGAGYSVLPYWEGGVGSSCFWDILKKAGYTVRHAGSGKMFDCYTFYAT